ncbi:hypothetical protein MKEN_00480700 [Mycena kentingensis (nom. inval.)]|nr:hypothetical protein MKEN_00480700 [Mycena kentingensis (nom. inval.)]
MEDLPLELLSAIFDLLETQRDVLKLRAVSQRFNDAVSPRALRTIVVRNDATRGEALSALQGCAEDVTFHVEEVVFRDCPKEEDGKSVKERKYIASQNADHPESSVTVLARAFSGLDKFPNLVRMDLDFHPWEEDDPWSMSLPPSYYRRLQTGIFAALASNPPRLVALTLHNLITFPHDVSASNDFHAFLGGVQRLNVSALAVSDDNEGWYCEDAIVKFWDTSMSPVVRSATGVTELILNAGNNVGAYPAISFKGTHLPHLQTLSLTDFVLFPWTDPAFALPSLPTAPALDHLDMAFFITKHKATLQELKLYGCSIDGGEQCAFPRPWHAVFKLFEAELGALTEFVFAKKPHAERERPLFYYTRLDVGYGYMEVREEELTAGTQQDAGCAGAAFGDGGEAEDCAFSVVSNFCDEGQEWISSSMYQR